MNELLRQLLFLPEQSSTVARRIDYLHYFVIIVTMSGAFAVAAACTIFLIRYRRRAHRGKQLGPDLEHGHTRGGLPYWFEGIIYGGLFALFLTWWIIGFRQYLAVKTAPRDATEIYVIGKKWMWSFAYPDGTGTNEALYVPVDRPVKLIMTSRDVIHSFYVPAFRVKQDVVPGLTTTLWFQANRVGSYQLFCAEYCGSGHSTMRGRVVVLSATDYERRMREIEPAPPGTPERPLGMGQQRPARVTMADRGRLAAAEHGCFRCHTGDGTPHIGPTFARLYGSTINTTRGRKVADEAYLTRSMMDPLYELRVGYQAVMPSYQGLITAPDTAAIVEYIRSLATVPVDVQQSPLPRERTLKVQGNEPAPAAAPPQTKGGSR